jgi:peptide chain release factor 1
MSETTQTSDRIEAVSETTADGEQLVSVAVPPTESVREMRQLVEQDHAEAEYLDAREEVRRPLERALEETRRTLHEYDETPENGLAVYTGVVEGDLVQYVFDDLADEVTTLTYGYANEFDVSPLEPATESVATYGLLVVTRERATLGRYDGRTIERVETLESDVPSKQAADGRKEDTFHGRSEERTAEFFEAVGEAADRAFVTGPARDTDDDTDSTEATVERLLLGGSEVVADSFADGDYLPAPLADRTTGPLDIEYAEGPGLRQLVDAAEDADAIAATEARAALTRLFDALENDDPAVAGREDVEQALEYEAVETLLLADSLSAATAEELEAAASEQGGSTVVPSDLERTAQLKDAFDGVAALLRHPIE